MSEQAVDVDVLMAAMVNENGGFFKIGRDSIEADYSHNVLTIDVVDNGEALVIRLMDKDEVLYEDE